LGTDVLFESRTFRNTGKVNPKNNDRELMDSIKTSEKFKEYCDNEVISNAVHKIIVNKYPLTDNHCLLLLFADEKLP